MDMNEFDPNLLAPMIAEDVRSIVIPHVVEHLESVADAITTGDPSLIADEMVDFIQCFTHVNDGLAGFARALAQSIDADIDRQVGSIDIPDSPDDIDWGD